MDSIILPLYIYMYVFLFGCDTTHFTATFLVFRIFFLSPEEFDEMNICVLTWVMFVHVFLFLFLSFKLRFFFSSVRFG